MSAYVRVFLYILIFHFIPSPLHFSISKVTLPPVQTFGTCVGYTDRVQCCCKLAIHRKQLSPKWGCRVTHVPWQRGTPGCQYMTWSCQTENSVAKLTSLGISKALPGLRIQGGKRLLDFAEPLSTDCSWILGPIFSGAFKAGTNNTKLKVRGSH